MAFRVLLNIASWKLTKPTKLNDIQSSSRKRRQQRTHQTLWHNSHAQLKRSIGASTLLLSLLAPVSYGQEDGESAERAKAAQLAERFLTVLEKTPRRGTALDRVYGHHVEQGTVPEFVEQLKARTQANDQDGTAWMLLGLIESQRGEDVEAIKSFEKAEKLRAKDPLAPYYMSQSMIRIGDSDGAIAALERAIQAKPQRPDLMEMYQQLGRFQQRLQRREEALQVWQRFEKEFPNDPSVLEQIASTLAEDNAHEAALERYRKLVQVSKDDYKRTMFRVAAAETQIKLEKRAEGLSELEKVMLDLNPNSWMRRDVRRRIEQIFLRNADQEGLAKYYESWLAKNPEDVEGMAFLARTLSSAGRIPEASQWMEKALKLAPSRTDLRKAFIDQLIEQQKLDLADKEYATLVKSAPNNTDFLRDWGRLVWRNKDLPQAEREKRVADIWQRMIAIRPADAQLHAQVADLFRHAQLQERALQLYAKAVELAPNDPQYREYLGEYYFILKQPEKAIESWDGIWAAPRRTAPNLARAAEVYSSFGFLEKSAVAITEALKLQPKDFSYQLQAANYFTKLEKIDEAFSHFDEAEKLANEEQLDVVLRHRTALLASINSLEEAIAALAEKTKASTAGKDWFVLSTYQRAAQDTDSALASIQKAVELEPKSYRYLSRQAEMLEQIGELGQAIELNRRLIEVDRRSQDEYWTKISKLYTQLGQPDKALDAAQQLILASPSNTANYEFLSQLQIQNGQLDDSLATLRKAIRINPNEPQLLMTFAQALSDQSHTREAIETIWRAFEKSEEIDDKTFLTQKLVPLYDQLNQFDQLMDRFQRERQTESKRREMTICLAQAYQDVGDVNAAKTELETLLSEDAQDTHLLQQLVKLSEGVGDTDQALVYQRQLTNLAPSYDSESKLANLLEEAGFSEEAEEILLRITSQQQDPTQVLRGIDTLINRGRYAIASQMLSPVLNQTPDDWELIYREAYLLIQQEQPEEAKLRLQRILDLNHEYTAPSTSQSLSEQKAAQKPKWNQIQNQTPNQTQSTNFSVTVTDQTLVRDVYLISQATQLSTDNYYVSQPQAAPAIWIPKYYGQARLAAYGWLINLERSSPSSADAGTTAENTDVKTVEIRVREAAKKDQSSRNSRLDWVGVSGLLGNQSDNTEASAWLSDSGNEEDKLYFAQLVAGRLQSLRMSAMRGQGSSQTPHPTEQDLAYVSDLILEQIDKEGSGNDNSQPIGPISLVKQLQSSGGRPQHLLLSSRQLFHSIPHVVWALDNAGQKDRANQIILKLRDNKNHYLAVAADLQISLDQGDKERPQKLIDQLLQLEMQDLNQSPTGIPAQYLAQTGSFFQHSEVSISYLDKLSDDARTEEALQFISKAMDLNEAYDSFRRKALSSISPGPRSAQANQMAQMRQVGSHFRWSQNGKIRYEQLPGLPYLQKYSRNLTGTFGQVYFDLKSSNELDKLITLLTNRLSESKKNAEDPEIQTLRAYLLATVLNWSGNLEGASLALLESIPIDARSEDSLRLDIVDILLASKRFEEASDLLESYIPKDTAASKTKELTLLKIAEFRGDRERALLAARRLMGLRSTTEEKIALLPTLNRLGLKDLADQVLKGIDKTTGAKSNSQPALLSLYVAQGDTKKANQIAKAILQKTVPNYTNFGNSASYYSVSSGMSRSAGADEQSRKQAIAMLQQTGELKTEIALLKELIDKSPQALKLYERLFELIEVSGTPDERIELLRKIIALRPREYAWRAKLADILIQQGKQAEACDEYLILVRNKPSLIVHSIHSLQSLFNQAKRTPELQKAFAECDMKEFTRFGRTSQILSLFLDSATEPTPEITQIIERILDANPNDISYINWRFSGNQIAASDRLFALAKRIHIPAKNILENNPTVGFNSMSFLGNGRISPPLLSVLESFNGTSRRQEFIDAIQARIAEVPTWNLGKLVLLSAANENELSPDIRKLYLDSFKNVGENTSSSYYEAWLIADSISKDKDSLESAIKYYEKSIDLMGSNGLQNTLQYTPVLSLLTLYEGAGEKERIKKLLLKILPQAFFSDNDPYQMSQVVNLRLQIAENLNKYGFATDAVLLAFESLKNRDVLKDVSNRGYFGNVSYEDRFNAIVNDSLKTLDSESSAELVTRIFQKIHSTPSNLKTGSLLPIELTYHSAPVADVSIQQHDGATMQQENTPPTLSGSFLDLLIGISSVEYIRESLNQQLAQLQADNPNDLSVLIARCTFLFNTDSSDGNQVLADLIKLLRANPLESPESKPEVAKTPNVASRSNPPISGNAQDIQRRNTQAKERASLWILAKSIIENRGTSDDTQFLSQEALQAAKQLPHRQIPLAILEQWGDTCGSRGEKENAASIYAEAIEWVTARVSQGQSTLPMTNSESQTLLRIAGSAADFGLAAVSHRALKEVMQSDTPVPDIDDQNLGVGATRGLVARAGVFVPTVVTNVNSMNGFVEQTDPRWLQVGSVLKKWSEDEYPAKVKLAFLQDIVFPKDAAKRPAIVPLTHRNSGVPDSVAYQLVQLSNQLGEIDSLLQKVLELPEKISAPLDRSSVELMIYIEQKDFAKANQLIESLKPKVALSQSPESCIPLVHALMPALRHQELKSSAIGLLEAVRNKPDPANVNSFRSLRQILLTDPIDSKIYTHNLQTKKGDELREYCNLLLAKSTQSFTGQSPSSLQRLQADGLSALAEIVVETDPIIGLELLGRSIDLYPLNNSSQSYAPLLAKVSKHLEQETALRQYEIWKEWTLPFTGRTKIRTVVIQDGGDPGQSLSFTNWHELLLNAKEVGKLGELASDIEAAHSDGLADASEFRLALRLMQPHSPELVKEVENHITAFYKSTLRPASQPNNPSPFPNAAGDMPLRPVDRLLPHLVLVDIALRNNLEFRDRERFKEDLVLVSRFLRSRYATSLPAFNEFGDRQARNEDGFNEGSFKHWFVSNSDSSTMQVNSPVNWFRNDTSLISPASASKSALSMKAPLTGDFTLELEVLAGDTNGGGISFNGLSLLTGQMPNAGWVNSLNANGSPLLRGKNWSNPDSGGFRSIKIEALGDQVLFYLNGKEIYRDQRSPAAPWLTLDSLNFTDSIFRNIRFTKQPTVPEKVSLLYDDRLDGWKLFGIGFELPNPRALREEINDNNSNYTRPVDWVYAKGELVTQNLPNYRISFPNRAIQYERPLAVNERIEYEFYHSNGKVTVHPIISNVAFILHPHGVEEIQPNEASMGSPQGFMESLSEPVLPVGNRSALPLKTKDWNRVEIGRTETAIEISLNGILIYSKLVDENSNGKFGFLSPRDLTTRIRNVALSGDWSAPWTNDSNADLLELTQPIDDSAVAKLNTLISKISFDSEVIPIVVEAKSLPAEEAFRKLEQWVLPSSTMPEFRMNSRILGERDWIGDNSKTLQSMWIASPAIELVDAAKSSGKLDELKSRLEVIEANTDYRIRAKNSLLAMVEIASERKDEGLKALDQILAYARANMLLPFYGKSHRESDLLAAIYAARHPDFGPKAVQIAMLLREHERNDEEGKSVSPDWRDVLTHAIGHIVSGTNKGTEVARQWRASPYLKVKDHALGYAPNHWHFQKGSLRQSPGVKWNMLWFQSPLEGDFTVTGRRSNYDYHEVHVAYGLHAADPNYNLQNRRVTQLMHRQEFVGSPLDIPNWDINTDFKLNISNNRIQTYTNEKLIHEHFPKTPLMPWLAIQGDAGSSTTLVSDLRIEGAVTIPTELDLLKTPDGWRADYFEDWFTNAVGPTIPYNFVDGKLIANLRTDRVGKGFESVIQYARPMLEDGEVEFETYYESGVKELHPAIGRTAFLLTSDGLSSHPFSLAQYDQDPSASSRKLPIKTDKPLPIKEKDWNHVLLKLKGNDLTFFINGQEIATVPISTLPEERFIGFFRYADLTAGEIRNLKYRGDWPKALPSVAEQELALPQTEDVRSELKDAPVSGSLKMSADQLKERGLVFLQNEKAFNGSDQGLKLNAVKVSGTFLEVPRLVIPIGESKSPDGGESKSDRMECTLTYEDLELTPVKEGWGIALQFVLSLEHYPKAEAIMLVHLTDDSRQILQGYGAYHNEVNDEFKYEAFSQKPFPKSGKLHFVKEAGEVAMYVTDSSDNRRKLVNRISLGDYPAKQLEIRVVSSDEQGTVKATFTDLKVQSIRQ